MKKLILIALFASNVANAYAPFIENPDELDVGVECIDKDGIKYHDIGLTRCPAGEKDVTPKWMKENNKIMVERKKESRKTVEQPKTEEKKKTVIDSLF